MSIKMQSTSTARWTELLQPKDTKTSINSKNAYILALSSYIETLRLKEEKYKFIRMQDIILKYTGELIPIDSEKKLFQIKIKIAKTKLNSKLSVCNKKCNHYEFQTHVLQPEQPEYIKALSERRILRADRAILHLLDPIKNYNIEMLNDWYQYYELLYPHFETFFNNFGIGAKYFNSFLQLDRTQAGRQLPNIELDGKTYGYPDYYIKKLNVRNIKDAVLAALLGKYTSCCQSYSGESGRSCTTHGLTSPDGGFYVLFKKHLNQKDEVMAQAWTWRENNQLCFDSIEADDKKSQFDDLQRAHVMFSALAIEMVNQHAIQIVTNGYRKEFSRNIGYFSNYIFYPKQLNPLKYTGNRDSKYQRLLADDRLLIPLLPIHNTNTYKKLLTELTKITSTPIHQIEKIVFTLGFILQHNRWDMLDSILQEARKLNVHKPLENYIQIQKKFLTQQSLYNETLDHKAMIHFIESNPVDIHLFNKQHPLFINAAKHGHTALVDLMLEKNIYVDICNDIGITALFEAAIHGRIDMIIKLLHLGANIRGYSPYVPVSDERTSALETTTANQHTIIIQILLNKDPRPTLSEDRIKDITAAANTAITYRNANHLSLFIATRDIDFSKIICKVIDKNIRHLLLPHMKLPYPENSIGHRLIQQFEEKSIALQLHFVIDDIYVLSKNNHIELASENEKKNVDAFKTNTEILLEESKLTLSEKQKILETVAIFCQLLKIKRARYKYISCKFHPPLMPIHENSISDSPHFFSSFSPVHLRLHQAEGEQSQEIRIFREN